MNNKLYKSDDAVSPVIGVILMVAITVVLATVVFVLVSNLSKSAGLGAPVEVGITHNADNTFTVVSIADKISWSNVTIKDNGVSQSYTVNGFPFATGQVMTAGDIIKISGLSSGNHNVSMITRNVVFYQTSFVI